MKVTPEEMITHYRNKGERVDEVLYQEVMKLIKRVEFLEKSEEGYRSNWYKCSESLAELRKQIGSTHRELTPKELQAYEAIHRIHNSKKRGGSNESK